MLPPAVQTEQFYAFYRRNLAKLELLMLGIRSQLGELRPHRGVSSFLLLTGPIVLPQLSPDLAAAAAAAALGPDLIVSGSL